METSTRDPIISVVMPCLNEERTIAQCVSAAFAGFSRLGVDGEVVVADNGSTDGSPEIARGLGARIVAVAEKGYGNAIRGGVRAARGKYIVMGDSDSSYDFRELAPFYRELESGADLVMGNRFSGRIMPGAMPWKHRWIGNPVLSGLGRLFFRAPVGDFHCGLRAFSRSAFDRMDLQTPGMEFASEMVARAALLRMRMREVPIVLRKDGRDRPPHLRSWRDGWRHLKFLLLLSPLWLFTVPGLVLFAIGLAGCAWVLPGSRTLGTVEFDVHALAVLATFAVVGYQTAAFGVVAKRFAVTGGLHPASPALARFERLVSLEAGVIIGALMTLVGVAWIGAAIAEWQSVAFGTLNPSRTMRKVIPGTLLIGLGVETIFSRFLLSLLAMGRRLSA